jgi:hypothetical protein
MCADSASSGPPPGGMSSVPQSDESSPLYAELVRKHEREQIFTRVDGEIRFSTHCNVERRSEPVPPIPARSCPPKQLYCTVCGEPLTKGNQRVCSAKCRRIIELDYHYRQR